MSDFSLLHTTDDNALDPTPDRFWSRDLRLNDVATVTALRHDVDARLNAVRSAYRDRHVLQVIASLHGLPTEGTIRQLQEYLADQAQLAMTLLLLARFAQYKLEAAVRDVAEGFLTADRAELVWLDNGRLHRLAALVALHQQDPSLLVAVRVLDAWHRKGSAALVLADKVMLPRTPMGELLGREAVQTQLDRHFAGVHFEACLPRGPGSHLLCLRRNLRPAWHWNDDGTEVDHGHEEELIVLHFRQGGRSLGLSAATNTLPRRIADHLATRFFGAPCRYVEDHRATADSAIRAFLNALLDPAEQRLVLVEACFDNAPLAGSPRVIVTDFTNGGITPAITQLEALVGDVFQNLDDVRKLKVQFEGSRIALAFPVIDGVRVVHFWDSRIDNNRARAFSRFMFEQFGLELRSVETRRR